MTRDDRIFVLVFLLIIVDVRENKTEKSIFEFVYG